MRCFVVAGFLLTSASRGPSATAEPLVAFNYRLSLEWKWSRSRDVFRFWEISDNNSKKVQDRHVVSIKVE